MGRTGDKVASATVCHPSHYIVDSYPSGWAIVGIKQDDFCSRAPDQITLVSTHIRFTSFPSSTTTALIASRAA